MTRAAAIGAPPLSSGAASCAHCGLGVPRGLVRPDLDEQFCCHGCEAAFRTIHSCGLGEYYRLRAASTDERRRPEEAEHAFSEFDDPAFAAIYVRAEADGENRVELLLEGVHCAACVWLVERLPTVVPGVIEARLNLRRRVVEVRWFADQVRLSEIASVLATLGYRPHPARGVNARRAQVADERRMLVRIAVAGFCFGNVMLLAFALYGGAAEGSEARFGHLFRWLAMVFAVVSVLGPGGVFLRGALAAVRTRSPHLDLPIAVAMLAGLVWGAANTVRGAGEVYFDSITALVFLLLAGRLIQQRQQRASADAVELLHAFTPSTAHLQADGAMRDVPVEALRPRDRIVVRAGERVPADGIITEGRSTLDVSLLTGESSPVGVGIGDAVAAGAVNLSAPVWVRIEATGVETRIGRLMSLMSDAAERKAPMLTLANRIAGVFTVTVLVLAGACFFVTLRLGVDVAAERTIALLIVCCPCALGLATPLAMASAIGRSARRGIMIKGADALERLAGTGTMFLDKTGTVTLGRFAIAEVLGDERALRLAAAVERGVRHPIAQALTEAWDETDTPAASGIEFKPGLGVAGEVGGTRVTVGGFEALAGHGFTGHEPFADDVSRGAELGRTPIGIAVGGRLVAVAMLSDRPRADSAASIAALAGRGWEVRLLSGDDARVTRATAAEVGISADHASGGVSPEEKLETLTRATGLRVMVGDGVNDAAALAAADVGIAVHGGAEASLDAADVYLNTPGLSPILETLRVARSTRRVIVGCLCLSLVYNAAAATAALMGLIGPIAAAVLMPLSSIVVVAIAMRAGSMRRPGAND